MTGAPWEAEFRVEMPLAGRLIATQFPELAALPVRAFGEGWDNVAYLVGERYVFRFPRRSVSAELMATELRVLPAIAPKLPLPVPVPRFAGEPSDAFAWPFAGYERIPGEALSRLRLGDGAEASIARDVGNFLRALHAIDSDTVPRLDNDRIGRLDHARCMPKATQRLRELEEAGAVEDVTRFERVLEETAPGADDCPLVPVHGDLYGRHVLAEDESSASGVIDWGDVHRGHRAVDLAVAFEAFPASARDAFASGYGYIGERTWATARYRALYHSAMVAHYGFKVGDDEMLRAGLTGLSWGLV
ncbi:MAG: phosphotransferase [Candidatus Tumulicola sp.]